MFDTPLDAGAHFFSLKRTMRALLLGCAWLVCGMCSTALAQYRFDVLNTDSGLPQNSVYSILQTRDGYLWFTTLDGLVRYNGAQFTVFNKANSKGIKSNRFRSLFEDPDGTLWIGTEDGGVTRYRGGQFKTYSAEDGLPSNVVDLIRGAQDGALLVLTSGGLARLRGEKFEVISTDRGSIDASPGIEGPSGATWYRLGGELRRVKDGKTTTYHVPGKSWVVPALTNFYEDRQGRLWIGEWLNSELWMLKDEVLTRYGSQDGLPSEAIIPCYEDREGAVWFASLRGLARFKDGQFTTYTTAQGLSTNSIETIFEDREGTRWVGTRDNGLMRMTQRVVTTLSEKDGMKGKIFYPLLEDHAGNIWIGNEGLNRYRDGKFTYYPLNLTPQHKKRNARHANIQSFYEDRQGRVWIGHDEGLYRIEGERFVFDAEMSLDGWIFAVLEDRQGVFWQGLQNKLFRYDHGEVQRFNEKDGLQGLVQPILEDRQGRIWIGSYGGLAQYVDGRLVLLTEKDGLSSNRVRALYEDSDGVLWIGTYDGGLNRFKDGRFTSYTMKEGMFSNGVFAILEDARGNFWMSSNQGIYRVRKQQLNDFAEGKISRIDSISYGKADGMLNTECNGARHPAAIKTRDGRLWFPTFDGVAVVNPEAVSFNSVPPPVVIENVILDRAEMNQNLPLEIKPGQGNLEIRYAGLSFIKPESMRFKYKLEGLDKDWVDVGNRRTAYYPQLAPGSYTFRVIAANSDGVWNESGAQLKVTVIPPFYLTWWFMTLTLLGAAGLVLAAFRYRVAQLQQRHQQQQAFSRQLISSQEAERKRIAAELHDSLGQRLVVIKNLALIHLSAFNGNGESRSQIEEISAEASHAIGEVKEISYNLRPYQLDRIGLTKAVEAIVKKAAAASEITFTAEIDEIDELFSKESEINFYRIVQESLNNIIKHSAATVAHITIRVDEDRLQLTIEDNGKGFTPGAGSNDHRGGGFGLIGISERAQLLGGKLALHSAAGEGTMITIIIPFT
ncbi:MAG: two-component regulator propeller domain-containing protein [Blastocatellales bacterium]